MIYKGIESDTFFLVLNKKHDKMKIRSFGFILKVEKKDEELY